MFLGHFGVALAAKRVAPKPALGTTIMAAQLVDGVWPIFLLLGWESVEIVPGITAVTPLLFKWYPYTHSLVAGVIWGALLGGAYYAIRRDRNGALWVAALVVSHWFLDLVAHRPDLPIWPDGPRVGLGLWNSVPATLAVEFGLFAIGLWLYVRATRQRDRWGGVLLWLFVATLIAIYFGAVFGPPPPSVRVLAMSGLLGWLFVAWGYWIDRHRTPTQTAGPHHGAP